MNKWNNKQTIELFSTIVSLKNIDEAKRFFRDLLTEQELIEFGKRWQAAQMLSKEIPYSKIEQKTGLSSTTIARISKWLNRGRGGYQLMISRISKHHRTPSLLGKG
jgi:TrpR-related protein YerC/YecD